MRFVWHLYLEVEWLGCMLSAFSTLTRSCRVLPTLVAPVLTPTSSVCEFPTFPRPRQPWYCQILALASAMGTEGRFCFNLRFLISSVTEHLFICLLAIGDLPVHAFVHRSTEFFFLFCKYPLYSLDINL